MVSKAEEASKSAKETAEISARASQEAISRAEEVSKSAKETAEASIRAAREATEASKKAAKEAAEASIRVFEDLLSGAGGIGKLSQQVPKEIADALTETSQEANGKIEEIDSKASEGASEALTTTFGEIISEPGTDAKGKREPNNVQQRIETRLESLVKMYSSNQAKQTDEGDEEEED